MAGNVHATTHAAFPVTSFTHYTPRQEVKEMKVRERSSLRSVAA